eukprot:TRINITY_DN62815_c0_g1_i1.p1 TRINITY_DN62815_c0_g1~~TRINITY_DN62815_c0_g1_i1.p1  ORF type:complete len:347 (-),score=32.36 TRINITY_DN62815_c0_g1_i1:114-1106(-)
MACFDLVYSCRGIASLQPDVAEVLVQRALSRDKLDSHSLMTPGAVGNPVRASPSDEDPSLLQAGEDAGSAGRVVPSVGLETPECLADTSPAGSSRTTGVVTVLTDNIKRSVKALKDLATPRRKTSFSFVRSPSLMMLCSEPLSPLVQPSEMHLPTRHLAGTTLRRIREAMESDAETAPLCVFMEKLRFQDVIRTPWLECSDPGMRLQRSSYVVPLPGDIPNFVRRLIQVPKHIKNTVIYRLCSCNDTLFFTTCTRPEGFAYSDRVYFRHIHCFKEGARGGVEWSQWSEVHWTKPLPWTHQPIRSLIERRAKAEAKAGEHVFANILKKAIS